MRKGVAGGLGSLVALVVAALAATTAGAAAPNGGAGSAREATNVSGNWAGYAITLPSGNARSKAFRTVSASWVVAPVTCSQGRSYSAIWVGLGGYHRTSRALEQIGTEADCSRSGSVVYSAWYELVPNAPVTLHVRIHAGDSVAARVTVSGARVAVALHDATTGASFSRTLHFSSPDVSSAEWIAEVPSACDDAGNCSSLRLANFGTTNFSGASVTAVNGRQGTIADPAWNSTEIILRQDSGGGRSGFASGAASATPSALSPDGASFAVTWNGTTPSAGQTQPPFLFPGGGPAG